MKTFKLSMLVLLAINTASCTKDTDNDTPQESPITQQGVSPEVLSKLESRGFDISLSPVIATEEGYLVEGDILVKKESLEKAYEKKQSFFNTVRCSRVRNIRIQNRLGDNEVGRGFNRALRFWNNVNGGSILRLIPVTNNPDILVRLARPGEIGGNFGVGEFPSDNGVEGGLIRLDRSRRFEGERLTATQWGNILAHEIGHNIGFAHSTDGNRSDTTQVPGTPDVDRQSIMTPGGSRATVVINSTGLSTNDKRATRRMYSNNNNRLCN